MASDCASTFSYDDESLQSDSFSLIELNNAVNAHFGESCVLSKLAQGGYHKVYDIQKSNGVPLEAVVRVASPAFPRDKLESEIATLRFVSSQTTIPVPRVYSRNSDRANPVGAEYMIMEKVRGITASDVWEQLDLEKKNVVVSQIAGYLVALFKHRFATGGSLYISSQNPSEITVGPIVIPSFYRALDGELRVPSNEWPTFQQEQAQFRGPFSSVTNYLLCAVKAELNFVKLHRPLSILGHPYVPVTGEAAVAKGEAVLLKALELYPLFPGNMPVYSPMSSPDKPFSICLDDFGLSNIMVLPFRLNTYARMTPEFRLTRIRAT
ncbi:hypothetical protein BDV93DRAFT_494428 [Ceratobasidium sp. AG-I]|nr:hypothetical protein BDV93DRAFT_494428 [Ceratobasidium sp. AG-I]